MDRSRRRARRTDPLLAGYVSGPSAATEATTRALGNVSGARSLILVEGVSDQIAVEAFAERRGRDLVADGVVVVPTGGVHAFGKLMTRLRGDLGDSVTFAGLYDVGEEAVVRRCLQMVGFDGVRSRADIARLGFHACVEDLEDELIRATGVEAVLALIESQGDSRAFQTLQHQGPWEGRPVASQLRRFMGSGGRRKSRYARLLPLALEPDRAPEPIRAVLGHT